MTQSVGQQIVESIYNGMKIDSEWSVRDASGFTWWPWSLAQSVWFEGPVENNGVNLWRIHARTDLVSGFTDNEESWAIAGMAGMFAMLSAIVRDSDDPTRLQLATSAWVHEEVLEFMSSMLAGAVALQAVEAHRLGAGLMTDGVGQLAASGHPKNGMREEPDEMLDIVETFFQPAGQESLALALDFREAAELLRECGWLVMDDDTAVSAEFGSGKPASVVTASGVSGHHAETSCLLQLLQQSHPLLGNGVLILGRLGPFSGNLTRLAIELNEFEVNETLFVPSWGSWCVGDREGILSRTTFIPNALYKPGALTNLAVYSSRQMTNGLETLLAAEDET